MAAGENSTLVIHPTGLADVTMNLDCDGDFIVPAQTVNFNEHLRRQVVYGDFARGDGGEAISDKTPLVPVTWNVSIRGTTKEDLISSYNTLERALTNRKGGTIEFKPDGVGAGVLSTFFHYVQSSPPKRVARPGNRWDDDMVSSNEYTMYVEVEFKTQPAATSDPDNPTTLTELADTLENWSDDSPAQDNTVTISASNLKGSLPALVRFMARPGSGQYLGRLIVFRRDSGECTLANFVSVYEAEDASEIYPSVAWSSVADANRGDGAYMKCSPPIAGNGVAQGLQFTISNPGDHKGRLAVFGVCYDDNYADGAGVWTHQVKLRGGNVVQEGDEYISNLKVWGLLFMGEFELPISPLSDAETAYNAGPYLEWYSTRASGSSEFYLDGVLLVYVSDSTWNPTALDILCNDYDEDNESYGVTNSEKLLVENLVDEWGQTRQLTHVVAQSDDDFKRALVTAPRGDFMLLDPSLDHLLTFIQEQVSGHTILDDDFSGYEGDRWFVVDDMDSAWTLGTPTEDNLIEGDYCLTWGVDGPASIQGAVDFDLENEGRFQSGDFVCLVIYPTEEMNFWILYFDTVQATDRYYYTGNDNLPADEHSFLFAKKSSFIESGSPDWSDINYAVVLLDDNGTAGDAYADFIRIEKADPDDADNPNATGDQWNFQPVGGHWTITKDISGAGATLACLDIESGVEKSALIDEVTPGDVQFRAKVMAKRDAGYAGIVWRAGNDTLTEGAEDCYAALLDISNDVILVREYAAGSSTQHDNPAFTCAVDTWYTIGVIAKGSTFYIYATASSNLTDDDDVFASAYLLSTVTDATLTSGSCGVMSISTLGRFDEVNLVSKQDKVVPADDITLEGKAIFRTIAPFGE
jgi:hypothetical protein